MDDTPYLGDYYDFYIEDYNIFLKEDEARRGCYIEDPTPFILASEIFLFE